MTVRTDTKQEIIKLQRILKGGKFSFGGEKELLEKTLPILEKELKEEQEQIKKMTCDICHEPFTSKDKEENNYWMITSYENYQTKRESKETVRHKTCELNKEKTKKNITHEEHFHPKLLKLKVNKTKIIAFLEDKREISIPVSELAKRWGKPKLKAEQLKKYEIGWGFRLHFPDADVDTSVLIFTGNYCGCC